MMDRDQDAAHAQFEAWMQCPRSRWEISTHTRVCCAL